MPQSVARFTAPRISTQWCRLPAMLGWLLLLSLMLLPVQAAQLSDAKVEALVEALRLSAPPAGNEAGLYSPWKIKADNITRWSPRCLSQPATPEQLAADETLAHHLVICVMGPVLREQFSLSQQNEVVAVQRAAAWWLTGDAAQYRNGSTGDYTLKVLEAYLRFF